MIQILKNGAPYVRALDSVAQELLSSLQTQEPMAVWSTARVQMGRKPKPQEERLVKQSYRLTRAEVDYIASRGGAAFIRHLIRDEMTIDSDLAETLRKEGLEK